MTELDGERLKCLHHLLTSCSHRQRLAVPLNHFVPKSLRPVLPLHLHRQRLCRRGSRSYEEAGYKFLTGDASNDISRLARFG